MTEEEEEQVKNHRRQQWQGRKCRGPNSRYELSTCIQSKDDSQELSQLSRGYIGLGLGVLHHPLERAVQTKAFYIFKSGSRAIALVRLSNCGAERMCSCKCFLEKWRIISLCCRCHGERNHRLRINMLYS